MGNVTRVVSLEELVALALAWGLWGGVHSLLVQEGVRGRLQAITHLPPPAYRLFYSIFAMLSILPPLLYTGLLGGGRVWLCPWPWWPVQVLLAGGALGLILWAEWYMVLAGVDNFGLKQAMSHHEDPFLLVRRGPYARLRHPMYVATFILLWARALTPADLATSLSLSLYLVLGTWHEERKLRRQLGKPFLDYARKVPIIPGLKW
jgi:protein-S-isoprenylcysteine O-methyltransferase Ste14